MKFPTRRLLPLLFILYLAPALRAQLDWVADHPGTIVYTLDLANVQQHELHVTVTFPAVPPGVFTLKMPSASPGRYAVHNFAKNVYDLRAFGADGTPIAVHPTDLATWVVTGHGGGVRLEYTLFANDGDGTYSGIDDRKLHLNMPASFIYGEALNERPVVLQLTADQRPEWDVATQLVPIGNRAFAAPDYYYFYDSPTLVGTIMRDEFQVTNPDGKVQTIELAMMHEGTREQFDEYLGWTEDIVLAQQAIYGELPAYDYGRYTFLCAYNPWISGDGMEHRNSTICSAPVGLKKYAKRLIGTVSHEFFHCWNVERIRPASLEPFHFDHANMSGELWFAEGFTSYYDDLALVRAGVMTPAEYAKNLTGQLNYVLLRPGRAHRGPIAMSQQAPFVDAATANDPDNFANTFVSYYPYGATIGLALDLELRRRGHTLDELMRLVWQRYGKTEIPYHIRDLELALGDVVDDRAWAKTWFTRHVYDSELPDFAPLLADYGFELTLAYPDTAALPGLGLETEELGVKVTRQVRENTPLFAAGVDEGSVIKSIDGVATPNPEVFHAVVAGLEIGRNYEVVFEQLGRERRGRFTAAVSPELVVRVRERMKRGVMVKRSGWLGTK